MRKALVGAAPWREGIRVPAVVMRSGRRHRDGPGHRAEEPEVGIAAPENSCCREEI